MMATPRPTCRDDPSTQRRVTLRTSPDLPGVVFSIGLSTPVVSYESDVYMGPFKLATLKHELGPDGEPCISEIIPHALTRAHPKVRV